MAFSVLKQADFVRLMTWDARGWMVRFWELAVFGVLWRGLIQRSDQYVGAGEAARQMTGEMTWEEVK